MEKRLLRQRAILEGNGQLFQKLSVLSLVQRGYGSLQWGAHSFQLLLGPGNSVAGYHVEICDGDVTRVQDWGGFHVDNLDKHLPLVEL